MYRLIPTEEEVRDEDRTETGSLEEQHDPQTTSNTKGRLNSVVNMVKSMVPSFLRRSAQWNPSTYARGSRYPPGRRGQHGGYHHKKKQEYRLDRQFLKRISNILSVLMNRRSTVFWLYIFMTLFCTLNEGIVYYVGTIPSRYYKVLGDKDQAAFFRLLIISLGTVFLAGFGKTFIFFLGNLLSLESRKTLTLHFHQAYLQPKLFYRLLMMHEDVDNPDQRITQDIDKISESLKNMVEELIIMPLLIIFYTWQCWAMAGYIGPLCIYGFFFLSSFVSRLLMNPIVDAIFYRESAEGYFRFLHVRFRQFAESIAFSRGEGEAKESADDSLHNLLGAQLDVIYKEAPFKFLQESVSYFGSILSYVIIAIPIFMGKYDNVPPSEIAAVISKNSFVSMYLTYQFSKIIKCGTFLSDIAGYASRLGQLMEALDELKTEMENIAIDFPHEESVSSDSSIRCENVSLRTPTGEVVVNGFSFRFEPGVNTMIVGPNGAGKTSILRAMGGLWPTTRGQIVLPQRFRKDLIFLPQAPYMSYGSLREQIVYPLRETAHMVSDADVIRVLKLARLEHLVETIEEFDTPYTLDWDKMLSPGEQQKMAFARLFYARPIFAVLDEATSSMDAVSANEMFRQCHLLKITCITVCHNSSLEQYHAQRIALDGQGGWAFSPIVHSSSSVDAEMDTLAGPSDESSRSN
ncbi:hypothetical protein CPC16_000780 [Podila verticillata]|nr:hypothetical protein CPC16_000780 [Podila verticillata]KAI9237154.1 MAG: ABC transporter transmembrane region 2-domain-containing protein [Podila humilis]